MALDELDSITTKIDSLYKSSQKLNQSRAFETMQGRFQAILTSANTLSSSRSLNTVSSQLDKLGSSVKGLVDSRVFSSLGSEVQKMTSDVTKAFSSLSGKSGSINVDSSSLAVIPSTLDSIVTKMPDVLKAFHDLRSEMRKTNKLASDFGSSLNNILNSDLRNPLTKFEDSLTQMFSPNGTLYQSMDQFFNAMSTKVSNIKVGVSGSGGSSGSTGRSGRSGSGGSSGRSGRSGGGGSSGKGGGFFPIVYGGGNSLWQAELLGVGFEALAAAAQNAASKIDAAVKNLNYVPQTLAMSATSPQYKSLFNSMSNEYRALDKQNIYTLGQESSAFNLAVAGGAKNKSSISAMFPTLLQMQGFGLPTDPNTASFLYQLYTRSGTKGLNQFLATLLKTRQLSGVVNGGSDILSNVVSNGSLPFMSGKYAARGASSLVQAEGLLQSSGASTSIASDFLTNIATMSPQSISNLQKVIAPSGKSIINIASDIKKGNYLPALLSLIQSGKVISQNPQSSLIAAQLGMDPQTFISSMDVLNSGGMYQKTLHKINAMNNSGVLTSSQGQIGIFGNQASAIASTTKISSKLASMAGKSAPGQAALMFGQNGFGGNPVSATSITDVLMAAIAFGIFGKTFGSGVGSMVGRLLGKFGLSKIPGMSKLAGMFSHGGKGGSGFTSLGTFDNPMYVIIKGTSIGSSATPSLFGRGGKVATAGENASNAVVDNGTTYELKNGILVPRTLGTATLDNALKMGGSVLSKGPNESLYAYITRVIYGYGAKVTSYMSSALSKMLPSASEMSPMIRALLNGGKFGLKFIGDFLDMLDPIAANMLGQLTNQWTGAQTHPNWVTIATKGHPYGQLVPWNSLTSKQKKTWTSSSIGGPTITSGFGMRHDPFTGQIGFHPGVDVALASGSPISSPISGIMQSGYNSTYGNYSVVSGNGVSHVFGHLDKMARSGRIGKGQMIAGVGTSGRSGGPHLHYETWAGGQPMNPVGGPTASPVRDITYWSKAYGVPPYISLAIAQAESSLNPSQNVVDSNGHYSTGLFQLNQLGQGAGYPISTLENPFINSQIGIKPIAAAYKAAIARGVKLSPVALAGWVAGHSGHPGGFPYSAGYYTSLTNAIEGYAAQYLHMSPSSILNLGKGPVAIPSAKGTSTIKSGSPTSTETSAFFKNAQIMASEATNASSPSPSSSQASYPVASAANSGNAFSINAVVDGLAKLHSDIQALHATVKRGSSKMNSVSSFE